MHPQRYQIKILEAEEPQVRLPEFVPVFHQWIRENVVDELLIDVADYKHVPGGPGILLVGFDADYSVNEGNGKRGLTLVRKRSVDLALSESLALSVGRLARAARLLEKAPELSGKVRYTTRQLEFTFLDRLALPTGDESFRNVVTAIEAALMRFEGGAHPVISYDASDHRLPLRVSIRLGEGLSLDELSTYASSALSEVDA